MNISKVDNAIEVCEQYLSKMGNERHQEIETFLTCYLLVLISACFEEEFEKMFIERAEKTGDSFVVGYFKSEIPNKMKSVGISKLSGFIQKFGNAYKERFIDEVSQSSEATLYNNIITNRHLVAHETRNINMTFDEVVDAYRKSVCILDKVRDIINS